MFGFCVEPIEHAEASKISLYGIADYTWNMTHDPARDWKTQAVLPGNYEALRTFALYNKDLGPNGHGFRREEGDEIKPLCSRVLAKRSPADVAELKQKCEDSYVGRPAPGRQAELRTAARTASVALAGTECSRLWRSRVQHGIAACPAGISQQLSLVANYYAQARSIQQQMYELENSDVRHALQPGIKLASRRMPAHAQCLVYQGSRCLQRAKRNETQQRG